jgi:hypothetical protein
MMSKLMIPKQLIVRYGKSTYDILPVLEVIIVGLGLALAVAVNAYFQTAMVWESIIAGLITGTVTVGTLLAYNIIRKKGKFAATLAPFLLILLLYIVFTYLGL